MSEDNALIQRRKTQVIAAALGTHVALGGALVTLFPGMLEPQSMQATLETMQASGTNYICEAIALVFCFAWLTLDSHQLQIRRPWWLNLGVIFLKVFFIPYYLFKTRAANQRGSAILAFFGLYFGAIFAMAFGAAFAMMFGFAPMPPAPHAQGL